MVQDIEHVDTVLLAASKCEDDIINIADKTINGLNEIIEDLLNENKLKENQRRFFCKVVKLFTFDIKASNEHLCQLEDLPQLYIFLRVSIIRLFLHQLHQVSLDHLVNIFLPFFQL